ncbi:hypothetical protein [Streptomyces sp. HPF1205]|uniref:hypothetical protein n=1 Tax=Streptomyces sp. HPF1205 TaxID=2873262 RepID=UPI001CED2D0A|nr:hypothetical protein [Streptomyces sp. HPF1205]
MTRLAFDAPTAAAPGEAAEELAGFLGRLLKWDKAAVVRLRSAPGEAALGVFGQPPFGGVIAVKGMALGGEGVDGAVEATVSAGQLLDAVAAAAGDGGQFVIPASVTGPAWAGLLPPRGGWQRIAELPGAEVRATAAQVVAEFRSRTEGLPPQRRTREELDSLAEELWTRPYQGATLRAVHAAYALGFLRVPPGGPGSPGGQDEVAVLRAGSWVRIRTGYGSVASRGRTAVGGLTVSPV